MVSGEAVQTLFVASLQPIVTIDNGGKLYVTTADYNTIQFAGGTGELVLDNPTTFHGEITGFASSGPGLGQSDVIDVAGENFLESANFHATYFSSTGILTIQEGLNPTIALSFQNYTGGFGFASDGNGGTLVYAAPAVDHWTNASGGSWSTSGNWSNGVPLSSNPAVIDAGGTYTVTNSANELVTELITIATATLDITGGTLTLTGTGTSDLAGAVTNGGTIDVQNGRIEFDNTLANPGRVNVGSGAFLDLNGGTVSGGTITDDGAVDVSGTATLENGVALNGGALSIAGGATLKIEGTGATFSDVGVTNGGTIQVDQLLTLGGGTAISGGTITDNGTIDFDRHQQYRRRDGRHQCRAARGYRRRRAFGAKRGG